MKKRRGITVIRQRKSWDCGIACLVMLTGRSYGDVAAVAREIVDKPKAKRRGLIIDDVEQIAARFGVTLRRIYRKRDYLRGRTGILGLLGGEMDKAGHFVILKSGPSGLFIVDPDGGESWDAMDYLAHHKARPCTLLVEA